MPRHTQSQFIAAVSYGYQHNGVHRIHVFYKTNGFRPADHVTTERWGGEACRVIAKYPRIDTALQPALDFMLLLLFVYLFSWRYNPLWLYFHSPVAGFSLLVFRGFLITHDAPQSVGLLWTSYQSVAETST